MCVSVTLRTSSLWPSRPQPHLSGCTLGWNTVPMRSPAMILGMTAGSTALQNKCKKHGSNVSLVEC